MTEPASDSRFEQARIHFFAGLGCFESGEFVEAERHFLASLEAVPGRASTLINLAATRLRLLRPQEALADADAALVVEPGSAEACLHRATALMQLGELDAALRAFDHVLGIDDRLLEAWQGRGETLGRLGGFEEALASFERVLAAEPTHARAWSGHGGMLRELRRHEEAAHSFREAIRHGAERELHTYYLASVEAGQAPAIAPRAYVQSLFDDYADTFDEHLVLDLGYRAHSLLVDGLVELARGSFRSALDVGCGTGLCGPLLRPFVEQLIGLDLAPRMLAKAGELAVYDELVRADAVEFLRDREARYDLVVAADVFIYVGDLAPMFAAVRSRMDRGVFCFSIELLPSSHGDFELLTGLRYAHSQTYLRRLAAAHGFEMLAAKQAPIRQEKLEAVQGLFVYLGVAVPPTPDGELSPR